MHILPEVDRIPGYVVGGLCNIFSVSAFLVLPFFYFHLFSGRANSLLLLSLDRAAHLATSRGVYPFYVICHARTVKLILRDVHFREVLLLPEGKDASDSKNSKFVRAFRDAL